MATVNLLGDNMNTQLFTLTPGHLMGSAVDHETRENGNECLPLLPNATSGTESMATPSTRAFIDPRYRAVLPWSYSRPLAVSLLAHLPPRPVTDYLVSVYFNIVHWFMAILHEGHFLHHYRTMLDVYAQGRTLIDNTDDDFTFAALALTVVALGGRYTSMHAARMRRCRHTYVDFCRESNRYEPTSFVPHDWNIVKSTSQLFSVVRSNATDILACGTLATVQTLLLLGSLYLFHGDTNLTWSNSGCTVRAAHAVLLHKENSELHWTSRYYQRMERDERRQAPMAPLLGGTHV
ncbi:uncharacterized protein Z518_10261 [Rhinocladiella mackenziei CBS 650.93]|uniref:Xylanolytic transcriptional activator regulatory domain-containing protein n=1 Tax=Rhinocladiella mackenziei CBS 650.93 TaxID=1442369 RepID=A0A0D2I2X5_9EURO|nr:uncharacterized protein Z518_10261 [Rhinocladiella mackenziei CBS 650.93]KIX00124.1 hypothetical protein Z518_10261 [Rhinocladiella mackenziei CBS 650.93]